MKILKAIFLSICLLPTSLKAAAVIAVNTNNDDTGAYSLMTSSGTLISHKTTNNLRIGNFQLSDSEILDLWNAGDLVGLNSEFNQMGNSFSMLDLDTPVYDGIFQGNPSTSMLGWQGLTIFLFASTGSDFLDPDAEYFIYRFSTIFTDTETNSNAFLGMTPGTLLVGGFNNFSHDYDLGGGALPAFNTVAVVPEPATVGLLTLFGLAALLRRRHRQNRA